MNALLGLPVGRVQRVGWMSIHTVLQAMISCAGGAAAALFWIFIVRLFLEDWVHLAAAIGSLFGLATAAALMVLYVVTINLTTSDERLQAAGNSK
jgi:hypothetical protein